MTDSACACGTTNTLQNEVDAIIITVSHLQNLTYFQQMMLSERMQDTNEWDALFTLRKSSVTNWKPCKKAAEPYLTLFPSPNPKGLCRKYASTRVAPPQPANQKLRFLNKPPLSGKWLNPVAPSKQQGNLLVKSA